MDGEELKIIFNQDKAYLTEGNPMTFDQLGLPEVAKSFKASAYWIIKVINYTESEKNIFCEILSYQVGNTEFNQNQIQLSNKLKDIQTVSFRNINTTGLLRTVATSSPTSFYPSKYVSTESPQHSYLVPQKVYQPLKRTIHETFFIPLKNVSFKVGCVSFEKKFDSYYRAIEFTIVNNDIVEEFDAIKNYFANVLQTKKITVNARIEITDNQITSINAISPEIKKINKQLIDDVKFEIVRSFAKKKMTDLDKSLFTMDEYFDTFTDEKLKSTTFYKNDNEFFEDLLKISNTKHYKQLRFLSSKHSHDIMRLRYIHKPYSFIFLIQGNLSYHIVWETLDTEEATYIWHIPKDINVLKERLPKIDSTISLIKSQGKIAYINSTNDSFKRIYHDYSDIIGGFVKWKVELEHILK